MGYILDTNTCIYIIKKKPVSVLERFNNVPLGQIGISVITLAELEYGARKSAFQDKNLTEKTDTNKTVSLYTSICDQDHQSRNRWGMFRIILFNIILIIRPKWQFLRLSDS